MANDESFSALPAHPGAAAANSNAAPTPDEPTADATAAQNDRLMRRLDAAFVFLVLVFAFVAGSFSARNSDLFEQLAVGRMVAQGTYPFGADPFTFAGEQDGWINHAWLANLLTYLIYSISPAAMIVAKALLLVLIAELLMRTGRNPGQRLWIPAVLTVFAILAISARAQLQPVVLSYAFLALTLWILERPSSGASTDNKSSAAAPGLPPAAWWWLPGLCVLWVNCDQWFFLGPVLVGLYLAGEALQGSPRVGRLAMIFGLCLVACLVNPYAHRAFTLPPQLGLGGGMAVLQDTPAFRDLARTPTRLDFFRLGDSWYPARLAYAPLVLLFILSFAANAAGISRALWRLPVGLGFFLLSFLNATAIPFFAIVAAPIAALNFLDATRVGEMAWSRGALGKLAIGGRVTGIVGAVVLLLAAWTGQTHGQPHEHYRVGWEVIVDPLLKQTAEDIAAWSKQDPRGASARWFNFQPDLVHYLAWFGPGVRGFMDQRLPAYPEAAAKYVAFRNALIAAGNSTPAAASDPGTDPEWSKVLQELNANYVVFLVQEADPMRQRSLLQRLMSDPDHWPLLAVSGRALVFGYREPGAEPPTLGEKRIDLLGQAFGPTVKPLKRVDTLDLGPPADWQAVLFGIREPHSPATTEAQVQLALYLAATPQVFLANQRTWSHAHAAAAIGSLAGPGGPLANGTVDRLRLLRPEVYLSARDEGPPEALYLALRAARRAVAETPNDAFAHLALGQVYFFLAQSTRERSPGYRVPILDVLRRTQALAALLHAVALKPDLKPAHALLAELYRQQQMADLWLRHLKASRERDEPPLDLNAEKDGANNPVEELEKQISLVRDRIEVQTANQPGPAKVQAALENRLIGRAIELLEKQRPDELEKLGGKQGPLMAALLQLRLYIQVGRMNEARAILKPDLRRFLDVSPSLRLPEYEWYQLLAHATDGDFVEADRYAAELITRSEGMTLEQIQIVGLNANQTEALTPPAVAALLVGQLLLHESQRAMPAPQLRFADSFRYPAIVAPRAMLLQEATLRVTRACLALEAGDLPLARQQLEQVRAISGPVSATSAPVHPQAHALAEMYLGWLDAAAGR